MRALGIVKKIRYCLVKREEAPVRPSQPALRELERHPFIVREPGSGTRKAMGDFFRAQQISPHLTMEMSSNETIKQAVMAGMGLGFLSLHTMGLELRSGLLQILHVDNTPIMCTWNIVHLLSKILSPGGRSVSILRAGAWWGDAARTR